MQVSGSHTPHMHPTMAGLKKYPDLYLREWAGKELGALRCSEAYLSTLGIVLGNMARADTHGAVLLLGTVNSFATRQTMRTLLDQLEAAGVVRRWPGAKKAVYAYRGQMPRNLGRDAESRYERMQREVEEKGFERYCASVGIYPADCPY